MKVICVFAHPDDEIIWGWPITQDIGIERHLITVSDNHPKYGRSEIALKEVCSAVGIHLVECLGVQSEFYRLPTRMNAFTLPNLIDLLLKKVIQAITNIKPDFIFTHNPFGEYGHGDHRLIFSILSSFIDTPIRFTDACQINNSHLSFEQIPRRIKQAFFTDECYDIPTLKELDKELDQDWFEKCERIYKKHVAWSWGGHMVPSKLRIYQI